MPFFLGESTPQLNEMLTLLLMELALTLFSDYIILMNPCERCADSLNS